MVSRLSTAEVDIFHAAADEYQLDRRRDRAVVAVLRARRPRQGGARTAPVFPLDGLCLHSWLGRRRSPTTTSPSTNIPG